MTFSRLVPALNLVGFFEVFTTPTFDGFALGKPLVKMGDFGMVRGLNYLTMREMSVPDLKCGAFFFGTVEVLGFGSDVVFTLVVAMGMRFKIHLQNYFYLK